MSQAPPEPVYVLRGHEQGVNTIAFTEGDLLVSASTVGRVKVWDLKTRRPVADFVAHEGFGVLAVRVVFGGLCLLTQGKNGFLKLWNLKDLDFKGDPIFVIITGSFSFLKVAMCEGGVFTDSTLSEACSHSSKIMRCAPIDRAASQTVEDIIEQDKVKIVEVENAPSPVSSFAAAKAAAESKTPHSELKSPLPSSTFSIMASSDQSGENIVVWDLLERSALNTITCAGHKNEQGQEVKFGMLMCMQIFRLYDGELAIATGTESGHFVVYRALTGVLICALKLTDEPLLCVDFLEDTIINETEPQKSCTVLTGACGSAGEVVVRFQLRVMDSTHDMKSSTIPLAKAGLADVSIRRDRKIFATAGWDKRVRIYNWKTGQRLAVLSFHSKTVNSVVFRNDKEGTLCTCSADGRIALYTIFPRKTTS